MKIRKFRGASVDSLLKEIRYELGSEVHLLETRSVRQPGLMGFFRPRWVEISVAHEVPHGGVPARKPPGKRQPRHWYARAPELHPSVPGNGAGAGTDETPSDNATGVVDRLVKLGVPRHAATSLARGPADGRSSAQLPCLRHKTIGAGGDSAPRVVALVGPTGAGKTTTCAKLAARSALGADMPVGLVTVDTFRVGAVEQLRTYARILGAPLEVVMRPEEAVPALRRLAHCELIIVDTTGRAHGDRESLDALGQLLGALYVDETHLVLGMNTDDSDAQSVIAGYRSLEYNRLLLTKIDETNRPGKAIAMAEEAGVPLSYISTGQGVPDDLQTPDEALWPLLVGEMAQ